MAETMALYTVVASMSQTSWGTSFSSSYWKCGLNDVGSRVMEASDSLAVSTASSKVSSSAVLPLGQS